MGPPLHPLLPDPPTRHGGSAQAATYCALCSQLRIGTGGDLRSRKADTRRHLGPNGLCFVHAAGPNQHPGSHEDPRVQLRPPRRDLSILYAPWTQLLTFCHRTSLLRAWRFAPCAHREPHHPALHAARHPMAHGARWRHPSRAGARRHRTACRLSRAAIPSLGPRLAYRP